MIQRIWVLTRFLIRRALVSLSGLIYVIAALVYWAVLFPPQQGTPHIENYILIIGAFGGVLTFLVTLTVASRANEAANLPMVVRLPSRVEYLTGVLLASLLFAGGLQLLVAGLALVQGPDLSLGRIVEMPPIWLSTNVLAAVMALHASDFVAAGWSRVYVYGVLALFLFGQSSSDTVAPWLAARVTGLATVLINRGWFDLADTANQLAIWLAQAGVSQLGNVLGFVFWPFRALGDAVMQGFFDANQALAPAVMLLYATILFMLAADLFANKDLEFVE